MKSTFQKSRFANVTIHVAVLHLLSAAIAAADSLAQLLHVAALCYLLLYAAAACYYCHHVAAYSCLANGAIAALLLYALYLYIYIYIFFFSLNSALNNDHAACTHAVPQPDIYKVYNKIEIAQLLLLILDHTQMCIDDLPHVGSQKNDYK